ncbi:vacuole 14 protein [Naegleria gruberi]|uniref:Vacuole 14 protein n=1 Tax=Naegleria gruberi TaxID=5762 RepID=D2V7Y8_NAEGR|nr:vacuole 14 protein [Naegleria gruberi]EFC47090.1 vacuole 14 protein [Naegleria gruberi]|eukprot:XP_002679834.1 vacuole 14 protein [Naegleria gruberi strain NEG-M]
MQHSASSASLYQPSNNTGVENEFSEIIPLITQALIRNLTDKLKEKRKIGGEEIERLVLKLLLTDSDTLSTTTTSVVPSSDDDDKLKKGEILVKKLIRYLTIHLIDSIQPNMKKGGLWALGSCAIALYRDIGKYLEDLVPPILRCFGDQDAKVRFHASEAVYNVAKIARGKIIPQFHVIFDGLCKLSGDPDTTVQNANVVLDRLIKDIVTEDEIFNIDQFIPELSKRINTNDPYVRQFLLSWIIVLDSVPDIDLIEYLPHFLSGVFFMLSDPNREIVNQAKTVLDEFLTEIEYSYDSIDFGPLIKILIAHCDDAPGSSLAKQTAIIWIYKFLLFDKRKVLPYHSQVIGAILPHISNNEMDLRNASTQANSEVMRIIEDKSTPDQTISFSDVMKVIKTELQKPSIPNRICALKWCHILLNKNLDRVMKHIDIIFGLLLKSLSDPNEDVVSLDLQVLAIISTTEENFQKFLRSLLQMFQNDNNLLTKAGFIFRKLSVMLNPEKIFKELSNILLDTKQSNMEFTSSLVQTLNMILLTSKELLGLRTSIKKSHSSVEGQKLFHDLFKSWCHNSIATLTLCLLANQYKLASYLVSSFTEIEVTVEFLTQIDNLVQLLESPIFVDLRLQLLEPHKHPYLLKTLYGLMMLLPQTTAFTKLSKRLECVNSLCMIQMTGQKSLEEENSKEDKSLEEELLQHFKTMQSKFRTINEIETD